MKWNMNPIEGYSFAFNIPEAKVKKVIFNPPATIVLWSDHTKTIVKCMGDDIYSPEAGLALCIRKKFLGEDFKKTFRKWIPCGRPEKPETDIPKREKMEKEKEEESTWDWCMRKLKDPKVYPADDRLLSLFEAFDRMCADFEGHDFTGEDEMQYKK